jgi:hypothetical protein
MDAIHPHPVGQRLASVAVEAMTLSAFRFTPTTRLEYAGDGSYATESSETEGKYVLVRVPLWTEAGEPRRHRHYRLLIGGARRGYASVADAAGPCIIYTGLYAATELHSDGIYAYVTMGRFSPITASEEAAPLPPARCARHGLEDALCEIYGPGAPPRTPPESPRTPPESPPQGAAPAAAPPQGAAAAPLPGDALEPDGELCASPDGDLYATVPDVEGYWHPSRPAGEGRSVELVLWSAFGEPPAPGGGPWEEDYAMASASVGDDVRINLAAALIPTKVHINRDAACRFRGSASCQRLYRAHVDIDLLPLGADDADMTVEGVRVYPRMMELPPPPPDDENERDGPAFFDTLLYLRPEHESESESSSDDLSETGQTAFYAGDAGASTSGAAGASTSRASPSGAAGASPWEAAAGSPAGAPAPASLPLLAEVRNAVAALTGDPRAEARAVFVPAGFAEDRGAMAMFVAEFEPQPARRVRPAAAFADDFLDFLTRPAKKAKSVPEPRDALEPRDAQEPGEALEPRDAQEPGEAAAERAAVRPAREPSPPITISSDTESDVCSESTVSM